MKSIYKIVFALLMGVSLFYSKDSMATHYAGGNIKYECLGANSYLVTFSLFRDCGGISIDSNGTAPITFESTCGGSFSEVFPIDTVMEVSQLCGPDLLNSQCRGGALPGMQEYRYQKVVTLPPCDTWTMSWQSCCRNDRILNLVNPGSQGLWISATLNSATDSCFTSPYFEADPIPYACRGEVREYSFSVINPGGDSIVYEFVNAYANNATTPCPWSAGYSRLAPLPGITLDPVTGKISCTPTTLGSFVISVKALSYRYGTGELLGAITRDIQLVVINCSSSTYPPIAGGISNFQSTGGGSLMDSTNILVCAGDSFSFDIVFTDPDTNETVTLSSSVLAILPGSSVSYVHGNPSTMHVSWVVPSGSPLYIGFSVKGVDQTCPIVREALGQYGINVIKGTYAGPDVAICAGAEWVTMRPTGGSVFTWSVLSGSPLDTVVTNPTYNATCIHCQSPSFSPQISTKYLVTSNLSSSCNNSDSVTVTTATNYVTSVGPDTVYCTRDSITLFANTSIGGGFTYRWDNIQLLSDYQTQNPKTLPPASSTLVEEVYHVTISSSDGCVKVDSTTVRNLPQVPNPMVEASITTICQVGDSSRLELFLEERFEKECSAFQYLFTSKSYRDVNMTGGLVPTTSTSFPAPFGNSKRSVRQQYLYRASELQALGIKKGTITEIGFYVTSLSGASTFYDYSVKFECTSLNSMPLRTFYPVTQIVRPPIDLTIHLGWNMIDFTTPYIWDGVSNIIVELCFDNRGVPTTGNAITRTREVTVTPFFASSAFPTDSDTAACGRGTSLYTKFQRPDTRFGFGGGIDSSAYSYRWYPDYNISDTAINSPYVYPDTTTTYEVVFIDTFGVCTDTASITVSISGIDAGPDRTICSGDTITLQSSLTDGCSTGVPIIMWYSLDGGIVISRNGHIPTVTADSTSKFYYQYQNYCGCSVIDSVTVFVNEMNPPNLAFTPPDCGMSNGAIEIHSNGGSSPFTFSLDSGSFQIDSLFTGLPMAGYYTQYMDSNGCLSPMRYDTLQNLNTAKIDRIIPRDPLCFASLDGALEIFFSGTTTPPHTYSVDGGLTWSPNNPVTGLGRGNYSVIVRDSNGCVSFPKPASLSSPDSLIVDTVLLKNLDCFQDSTGAIEIQGHGGVSPYTYSIDNGLAFQTSSIFNVLDAALYEVILRDSNGCLTPVRLETLIEPALLLGNISIINDSCFNACGGSANSMATGGVTPYTYSWRKGVNPIGVNSPQINGLCAGLDYELTISDSNACQVIFPFTVTHPDLLVAGFTVQDGSCFGSNDGMITMTATGGVSPYKYSINGGVTFSNSPIFTGLAAGTYNLVVADSALRCNGVTTAIVLEPNEIVVTTNVTNKKVCISGCTPISAVAVGGTGAPYNFIWNQGFDSNSVQTACPTQTTLYSVYAVDTIGCTSAAKIITLTLYDSLTVDAGVDIDLCPGESKQLAAISSGGNGRGISYQWSPVTGLSGGFVSNPMASPSVTTTYFVKVTDNCETPSVTDSVTVNVHVNPTMDFIALDTTEGCEPFDITLVNKSTPVQFAEWTVGADVTAHGFQADVSDLPEGIYSVTLNVITPEGCVGEITKPNFITVQPKPTAKFSMDPDKTTEYNTTVQFTDESIGLIQTWDWDFDGQGTSMDQNPLFKFAPDTGTYEITLKVVSDKLCEDETFNLLRIGSEFNMYVPNSFTPNGDGDNDVFAPTAIGVNPDDYSLLIYDRWGGLIFESGSLKQPWDGRVQGTSNMAQNGIYVWKIVANDNTDKTEGHTYHGTVNLIR